MAGTKVGGRMATKTMKEKYGEDYFKNIGSKGGKAKVPKGFALNRELASRVGAIGGRISRRIK